MSDVASLELCKELYELNRWNGQQYWYNYDAHKQDAEGHAVYEWFVEPRMLRFESQPVHTSVPAYTLAYLLRKLPAFIGTKHSYKLTLMTNVVDTGRMATIGYQAIRRVGDRSDKAGFEFLYHPKIKFQHGNLEDAACKLAIELIKQGIIKP